jgi:hypothetical protein
MPLLPSIELSAAQQRELLAIARRSIVEGFSRVAPLPMQLSNFAAALRAPAAVFVTLTRNGELRGCIGSLQARDPLVRAVANAAFGSAFEDPRFEPLQAAFMERIQIEISVLSALQPFAVDSRADLLQSLRPGIDGLLIEDRGRRATFLPKVWEKIPDPEDFVAHLLLKAGLPSAHWSEAVRVQRYTTLTFADN